MPEHPRNDQTSRESGTGRLLQSALTIAIIALGLLILLPDSRSASVASLLIFAAGSAALYASVLALRELLDEQGRPRSELWSIRTSIGIIFWSIIFLAIAYVLIVYPDIGSKIAELFRVP